MGAEQEDAEAIQAAAEGFEALAADEGNDEEPLETDDQGATTPAGDADTATPKGQEAGSTLDPVLMHTAKRAGLSDEEIGALGSSAANVLTKLKAGQDEVSSRLGALGRTVQGGAPPYGGPAPQPQGQVAPAPLPQQPAQAAQQGTTGSFDPLEQVLQLAELPEDVIGPELKQAATQIVSYVNSLRNLVAPMLKEDKARREADLLQTTDAFFTELHEVYGLAYGEGSLSKMNPATPQYQARAALLQQADAIYRGARQQGWNMTVREAMERALSILSPELQVEAATQEIGKTLKRRQRQIIAQPSTRTTPKVDDGLKAAEEAYAERAGKLGVL